MFSQERTSFCLAILFALLTVGSAIKCWDCNSLINAGCGDPFNPTDFAMADCSQKHLPRFPERDGSFCRKTTQKINGQLRVVRGCGYLNDTAEGAEASKGAKPTADGQSCVRRTGTFSVMVEYCTCEGDGCNGAFGLGPNLLFVLFAFVAFVPFALQ